MMHRRGNARESDNEFVSAGNCGSYQMCTTQHVTPNPEDVGPPPPTPCPFLVPTGKRSKNARVGRLPYRTTNGAPCSPSIFWWVHVVSKPHIAIGQLLSRVTELTSCFLPSLFV